MSNQEKTSNLNTLLRHNLIFLKLKSKSKIAHDPEYHLNMYHSLRTTARGVAISIIQLFHP